MKKSRITTALLAIGISASMVFQTPVFATEETAVAVSSGVTTNGISGWPQGPEITSASAVIMEDTSDTILYAKDMDTTLSPAGAVKIMTCLLALENSQLDDQVTMTETGVSGVTDGGAHISSQLGEVFTMEQCLYALMLASANDIALQVAEQIGGSVDAFVQKMNDRAKELGCTNTVFTNPTGLPDDNQHTTAHDLALIMQAAIRNDSFRTISGATSYTIPATNVSGGTGTDSISRITTHSGINNCTSSCRWNVEVPNDQKKNQSPINTNSQNTSVLPVIIPSFSLKGNETKEERKSPFDDCSSLPRSKE